MTADRHPPSAGPAVDPRVDAFLGAFAGAAEAALPGRLRACYVIGSYADGSAVPLSDLDLVVLVKGHLADSERDAEGRLQEECRPRCPVRLDLTISGEVDPTWDKRLVKYGGRLVYGEDVRGAIVLPPPGPAETREAMRYAQHHIAEELRGGRRIAFPLHYPDPAGEFFGYDTARYPEWYPPGTRRGLRMLVNTACLIGAALLPDEVRRRVTTKTEIVRRYRECVGDDWAAFLEALYEAAKLRWGYLVPDAPAERDQLRELCRRMLALEHHFLARYRVYLTGLLRSGDEADRRYAAARLEEIGCPDGRRGRGAG